MACQSRKCAGVGCTVSMPACQLRGGLCPTCNIKKQTKPVANVPHKS